MHLLSDANYEVPMAASISAGNRHDSLFAIELLRQTRYAFPTFSPQYVLADAGYSSDVIRHDIESKFHATPLIDPNPRHWAAHSKWPDLWKELYKKRTSIERINGRLKQHRRLNALTLRRIEKVCVHVFTSIIVSHAVFLATQTLQQVREIV